MPPKHSSFFTFRPIVVAMRFATVFVLLGLTALAVAQSNSMNSSDVVTIMVGGMSDSPDGGLFQFIPNNVKASNGTVIRFMFTGMPGNHSITQSSFNEPCTDLEGGFDSGWVSIPNNGVNPPPEWNLTITNDQKPLWFFCKQLLPAPHCPAGMVGAINAATSGDKSFDNFRQAATKVMDVDQTENGIVGQGASASQRPSPIPSGASAFPDPSITAPASAGNSSGGGSGGGSSGSGSGSGSGSAPAATGSSGATNNLVMNSGLVALVAGMTALFLA